MQFLPPEIWHSILSYCDTGTLSHLTCTSKHLRSIATPLLYSSLSFFFDKNWGKELLLLENVFEKPTLANLCTHLRLDRWFPDEHKVREEIQVALLFFNNVQKLELNCEAWKWSKVNALLECLKEAKMEKLRLFELKRGEHQNVTSICHDALKYWKGLNEIVLDEARSSWLPDIYNLLEQKQCVVVIESLAIDEPVSNKILSRFHFSALSANILNLNAFEQVTNSVAILNSLQEIKFKNVGNKEDILDWIVCNHSNFPKLRRLVIKSKSIDSCVKNLVLLHSKLEILYISKSQIRMLSSVTIDTFSRITGSLVMDRCTPMSFTKHLAYFNRLKLLKVLDYSFRVQIDYSHIQHIETAWFFISKDVLFEKALSEVEKIASNVIIEFCMKANDEKLTMKRAKEIAKVVNRSPCNVQIVDSTWLSDNDTLKSTCKGFFDTLYSRLSIKK